MYRPKEIKVEEIAVFPLATPLLAGPGAISTVIILSNPPYGPLLALFIIALNMLVAWIILRQSDLIQRALGDNGTRVLTRIMGLLIAAVAVTFVREGLVSIYLRYLR